MKSWFWNKIQTLGPGLWDWIWSGPSPILRDPVLPCWSPVLCLHMASFCSLFLAHSLVPVLGKPFPTSLNGWLLFIIHDYSNVALSKSLLWPSYPPHSHPQSVLPSSWLLSSEMILFIYLSVGYLHLLIKSKVWGKLGKVYGIVMYYMYYCMMYSVDHILLCVMYKW